MEQTDREILLFMVQNPKWHIPSRILKGTGLKGRNPEKPMSINNIIKRCHFLVMSGFLKTPDPENDNSIYNIKKDGVFRINDNIETLNKLVEVFYSGTLDEYVFHQLPHIQSMINHELVEKIKTEWDYPKNSDIEKGYRVCNTYNLNLERIGKANIAIDKESTLSDEKVCELLQLSPTALRTLLLTEYTKDGLFGPTKADEKLVSSNFNEILILNMLFDLRRFGNLKNGTEIILDGQMKITLQIRIGNKIINLLGKPQPNFCRVHYGLTIDEIKKKRSELKEMNTEYYKLNFGGHYSNTK